MTLPYRSPHAQRLEALGAKRLGKFDEYGTQWGTFADLEGNEFDLGAPH